jgi:hypothetical protein
MVQLPMHAAHTETASKHAVTMDRCGIRRCSIAFSCCVHRCQHMCPTHPWTAWSCRRMSGCGSRWTARTGCRRTERCLLRGNMCPRRPAGQAQAFCKVPRRLPWCPKHVTGPREHFVALDSHGAMHRPGCSATAAGRSPRDAMAAAVTARTFLLDTKVFRDTATTLPAGQLPAVAHVEQP